MTMKADNTHCCRLTSVFMGLGHMRAAYALRQIAAGGILVDGEQNGGSISREHLIWDRMRRFYYLMSRAGELPLIGPAMVELFDILLEIPAYYPIRDLSSPTWGVRYLNYLIRNSGLSRNLIERLKDDPLPLVNTFYSTAMAAENTYASRKENYLLICDSDLNRVWVPPDPFRSSVKYLAPCTRVKKRLLSFGIPQERIFLTGFPLPRENIGSREKLEILSEDLYCRLVRLDPAGHFFGINASTVSFYLGRTAPVTFRDERFTLLFAVGGAGVQAGMAARVLKSLRYKIRTGRIRVVLSAGIREEVLKSFQTTIKRLGIEECMGDGIEIVYAPQAADYFEKFNRALRTTDVLWTKPSELSFYCGLGIPILMAPAVGAHEERNRTWLRDVHAGIKPAGPIEHTDQWLFDLRESGILAEAAWDGFLKGRKLGSYMIEELVRTGSFTTGSSPMQR